MIEPQNLRKEDMTEITLTEMPRVDLIDFMGGDDQTAMSAWVSFGNDNEERLQDRDKVRGLINFLYRNQHMTPFESSIFTFRAEMPIFVARELMRHRAASYNEWSGRYSKMIPTFYMPRESRPLVQQGKPGAYAFVPGDYHQRKTVEGAIRRSSQRTWDEYERMLSEGIAKEVARMVLPVNVYTQMYVTMNARNLMHFLTLRTDPTALQEIQDLARLMEVHFKEKMPFTYDAWSGVTTPKEADTDALKNKVEWGDKQTLSRSILARTKDDTSATGVSFERKVP